MRKKAIGNINNNCYLSKDIAPGHKSPFTKLLIKILIRLLFILLCSLLLPYSPVVSQTTGKALAFNALTINDGLSQGMVTCIFQDRYGFMWFATLDGLNRYDGYHFIVYRHNAQDQTSITESFVQTLFEDSKGRLWIGTVSGGLDLFDRETETFIHIKHQDGDAASLSQGPINSISEDEHGNIWVHVSDKLDEITINKKEKASNEDFSIHHIKVPFDSEVSFLSITQPGNIYYVNAKDGLIYKLDERTERWSVALNLEDYFPKQYINNAPMYRIVQLLEDKVQGKLYIFHEGGVICINEKTSTPEKVYRNEFFKNYPIPLRASLDKNGIVWFPSIGNLSCFDTHSGQTSNAMAKDPDISRSVKHAYSTFIDRSGLLWIGTSGYGILKRNTLSEIFHHTSTLYTYSIKEANDGKIILGNSVSRREIFDKTKGQSIAPTAGRIKNDTKYAANFSISPVATEKSGTWFADSDKLHYYDKAFKKNIYYPLPVTGSDGYDGLILCKIKDSSGNIWLGTTEGLLRFSLADRHWAVYKSISNDSSSLSSNLIYSLCLDPQQPKKYLWIGTSGGLNRMDMVTGKSISYSVKDGLPNNVIYGILNDDDGNLWMSTNKGLSCFNPQKQTFRNFDYKDGLQSNEFNRGAYCRTKDGCLFFGGVNGFNYFYPREILKNKTVPQIVITGLKIRNQPVVPVQPKNSPLTKVIYLAQRLTLPYEQNFVSFEFASMDFTYPEKNLYQYKLQGFDKDWIHSGNTHSATYTNLDPGAYTFIVKGSNNDGVWNEKGTSIQLIILPPWYMTWWFRTALAMAVILVGYAFYRYQLAQALKLQSIRDRIAKDLHDEVGSNLSNIYIFSNVAQQKATANDETVPLLQKITEYTQQSMEAMNDIVWMINTRNDRFENIMVRMRTIAAEFSETSGCSLHLDFDENLNGVKLNMEERKNFYLIYKEAINNTAKYAGCKSLWVEMKLDGNTVTLKIVDNGKGFEMANTNKGNGMFNMKKRAELLKGTLTVTSTVGKGTTLQLTFKV